MTLIKSISGIRGTIGGRSGETLSPVDVVRFTAAFAGQLKIPGGNARPCVVIGRDARISGKMISTLVANTLVACGFDVIDLGLSTTPTVEMAVTHYRASGGVIITASHNPGNWNALKLLDENGEFFSAAMGEAVLTAADSDDFDFAPADSIGTVRREGNFITEHIGKILALPYVDREAIRNAGFSIAVDAVNSTGGIAVPMLLDALGVKKVSGINLEPTGIFAHDPEPLPGNLSDLSELVRKEKADLGITVDPDVDRLALVCEDGSMFGEEYTLVAVADYVLGFNPGPTVSNLSSSRALHDVTEKHGQTYAASAVGEVNVVAMMKETGAVIGGEGNGGVILPELHCGRDALAGIALFLTFLAKRNCKASELRAGYPGYEMVKIKVSLPEGIDTDELLSRVAGSHKDEDPDLRDGVKIDYPNYWVHLRKSNTEPIIRIYVEATDTITAEQVAARWKDELLAFL